MFNEVNKYSEFNRNTNVPTRQSIFDTHQQILDKFYDEFFGNRKFFNVSHASYPKMDITEDSNYLFIKCAVPGIQEEDLDIEINKEKRILIISGQTSSAHCLSAENFAHLRELKNSAFSRSIRMPDYVDLDNSVAELKDGMLSLTFDLTKLKEQPPQNNIKKIKITKD